MNPPKFKLIYLFLSIFILVVFFITSFYLLKDEKENVKENIKENIKENVLIEDKILNEYPIFRAMKKLDSDTYAQIYHSLSTKDEKTRLDKLVEIGRGWAENNIDKVMYLSSDKPVIALGEYRIELFRQSLMTDPTGDLCARIMLPNEIGFPDFRKFSRDFLAKMVKSTFMEDMADSMFNNESASHYSRDEIEELYIKAIDRIDTSYSDLLVSEDIEYIKENKKRYCEMQIQLFEELISSSEHDAAELLRYHYSEEWPPVM